MKSFQAYTHACTTLEAVNNRTHACARACPRACTHACIPLEAVNNRIRACTRACRSSSVHRLLTLPCATLHFAQSGAAFRTRCGQQPSCRSSRHVAAAQLLSGCSAVHHLHSGRQPTSALAAFSGLAGGLLSCHHRAIRHFRAPHALGMQLSSTPLQSWPVSSKLGAGS